MCIKVLRILNKNYLCPRTRSGTHWMADALALHESAGDRSSALAPGGLPQWEGWGPCRDSALFRALCAFSSSSCLLSYFFLCTHLPSPFTLPPHLPLFPSYYGVSIVCPSRIQISDATLGNPLRLDLVCHYDVNFSSF